MALYSTYARTVLSNSASIASLIRKYSTAKGQELPETNEHLGKFSLLSMEQIEQALLNPQNSIKGKITLFAEIMKMYRYIIDLQQESHKQLLVIEAGIKDIRDKYTKADKANKEKLAEAVRKLEVEYRKIAKLQKDLEEQETELGKFQQKLNDMTLKHDQEWDEYREKYLKILTEYLKEKGISLTELEQNEIKTQDVWTEVIKRFDIQEIKVPDYINITIPDYITYFELKAYLAMHASLGRRMLPNSSEDIINA